jgi:cyclic pyranopterin phosphate synthase
MPLADSLARPITYLRVSVTDRCDFRCITCMTGAVTFLPKADILTFEELDRLCSAFIALGVRKLRLTGGEPLVRRGIMTLFRRLGRHLATGGLDELTLTTNGSQLARFAGDLAACGVRRVNISLDSLDPARFAAITQGGCLDQVLAGIAAAQAAGLAVKLNCVALKDGNDDEFDRLLDWCGTQGCDLTLIEVMPLGATDGPGGIGRQPQYLPLSHVREQLARRWTFEDSPHHTGGPARFVRVAETGRHLGFITPHTDAFCETCNRVRLTCTGMLFLCLGRDDAIDLRPLVRAPIPDDDALTAAIRIAIAGKPKNHDFAIERPAVLRFMNATGG